MLNFIKNIPHNERRITLATVVTLLRLLFVPFIIVSMVNQKWDMAFWLFIIASVTDFIDGGLARLMNDQTMLGAALDPIVDKFLVLSIYFTLSFIDTPLFSIPKWFFVFILLKEFGLIFGGLVLFYKNGPFNVKPTYLGKFNMLLQVVFVVWLFSCYFFDWLPIKTYYVMLSLALFFSIATFLQYFYICGVRSCIKK